ncbi:hypothetical protein [Veillonella ratti]|uniref:hypothetical protein n=1 Tax=Veillonella ratti TaxID=103892 RepID=UPI000F8ED422|nr:hypothetical protein [Veillonella ratti]
MKYRTLVGFSGVISAPLGAVIELDNEMWERDLVNAGYIEVLEVDEAKPKGRGRGKKNEG